MSETDVQRDEWMKRTGPFYPLLVAFTLQSSLPIAGSLAPSSDDLTRATPWLAVCGVAIGAGVAALAALLLVTPVVPALVGLFVVAVATFITGGWNERGLWSCGRQIATWWTTGAGGWSTAAVPPLPSGVFLALALVRVVCLIGTETDAWVGVLVGSIAVGRLALVALIVAPTSVDRSPVAEALASASRKTVLFWSGWVVLAVVVFSGVPGLLALLVAGLAVLLGRWLVRRAGAHHSMIYAATAAAAELGAMVVFAGWVPATASPLIGG